MTVLNPKYPRLSSGDANILKVKVYDKIYIIKDVSAKTRFKVQYMRIQLNT